MLSLLPGRTGWTRQIHLHGNIKHLRGRGPEADASELRGVSHDLTSIILPSGVWGTQAYS